MATYKTSHANEVIPMPVANGAELVSVRMELDVDTALALNDIIHMGFLPEDHIMVDAMVDADELDTGADAITLQAGALNTGATDIDLPNSGGASWVGSSTVGQAGGVARADSEAITRVPVSSTVRRNIGLKVAAGPGTGATGVKVGLTVWYRAATHAA